MIHVELCQHKTAGYDEHMQFATKEKHGQHPPPALATGQEGQLVSWRAGPVQGTRQHWTGHAHVHCSHTCASRWKGFDTDLSTPLLLWRPVLVDQPWTPSPPSPRPMVKGHPVAPGLAAFSSRPAPRTRPPQHTRQQHVKDI